MSITPKEITMLNEDRITVLETQVRTLKRIVCLVCSLLVAGVIVSATSMQTVPNLIQAKSIEVVNDDGTTLVRMGVTKNGQGMIRTMNAEGEDLVRLGVTISGKGIVRTMNGMGQELVQLGVNTKGQGIVKTMNGMGQPLVRLGVDNTDQGTVWTYNKDGNTTASLP